MNHEPKMFILEDAKREYPFAHGAITMLVLYASNGKARLNRCKALSPQMIELLREADELLYNSTASEKDIRQLAAAALKTIKPEKKGGWEEATSNLFEAVLAKLSQLTVTPNEEVVAQQRALLGGKM